MPQGKDNLIRIFSARDLEKKDILEIVSEISEKIGIKNPEYEFVKDPGLIGGVVIYASGFRYDYSIKGQLERIASDIKLKKTEHGNIDSYDDIKNIINKNLEGAIADFSEIPLGENFFPHEEKGKTDEIGYVLSAGDGVARISDIGGCKSGEILVFSPEAWGIAMDLYTDSIGVVILGRIDSVYQGMVCVRTGRTIHVPSGKGLLGRVVNSLGVPVDGKGPLEYSAKRPIEYPAPSIIQRQPVSESLHTGITAIDAMVPVGKGQRELIIGDRQTGKTAIAVDTIINQKNKGVYCIYVAIGQKMSTVAGVVETLRRHDALTYTTVVIASAGEPDSMQYIAPYAGCAMAEELMYNEKSDVLIVYDDLTKHAQAYRTLSLLLKRPPGREAYPGDVFYLHSRLLERAGRLSDSLGGGSITALPVLETQNGDISAYIPTNVISITDGQIYLETKLFFSGQRPAVSAGLSVSRVGAFAQSNGMKKVGGPLRINLSQYNELEAFAQFGEELEESTRATLVKGKNLYEVLKQKQYAPLPLEEQIVILHLANRNMFTSFETEDIRDFLKLFINYIKSGYPQILDEIKKTGDLADDIKRSINLAFGEYYRLWASKETAYEE